MDGHNGINTSASNSVQMGGYSSQQQGGQSSGRRRRSKYDNNQRNFVCGCGKSYLSYAALYTHCKTKHEGQFPNGTTNLNKKKQGRPKKEDSDIRKTYSRSQKRETFVKDFKSFLDMIPAASPTEEEPGDSPLNHFPQVHELTFPDYPKRLYDAAHDLVTSFKEEYGEDYYLHFDRILDDCSNKSLNCTKTLALFALYVGSLVSETFLKEVVVFLGMYIKMMDEEGWEKYKEIAGDDIGNNGRPVFCEDQPAEFVPDCSNYFITEHFPKIIAHKPFKGEFEYQLLNLESEKLMRVILIIKYMCAWLKIHGFSEAKVSLSKVCPTNK